MANRNKPLDRDYFKRKANRKIKKGPQLTKCCGQDKDSDNLNVNYSEDWKLIENHIERHLREYTKHISVTPVSCEQCGILLEYVTEIDIDKTLGFYEKAD